MEKSNCKTNNYEMNMYDEPSELDLIHIDEEAENEDEALLNGDGTQSTEEQLW